MSSSAAANWHILADQGKTLARTFRYGTRQSGVFVPFDNTGWSARMMVRKSWYTTPVVSLTSGLNGGIVLGGANGEVSFTVSAAVTAGLVGEFLTDLELWQVQSGVEVVVAPFRGKITFRPEVTV